MLGEADGRVRRCRLLKLLVGEEGDDALGFLRVLREKRLQSGEQSGGPQMATRRGSEEGAA